MFNTCNKISTNLKINACSGGIYKTYKESWFERFYLDSARAATLFSKNNNEHTIVLQMVICGEKAVMAELITEKDFEKYCND